MKRSLLFLVLTIQSGLLYPQVEQPAVGLGKGKPDYLEQLDTLRLSDSFMRELDRAFSLSPMLPEPLVPRDTLSIEQLHEWVGKPNVTMPNDTSRFNATYFALKMYEKEFMVWDPSLDVNIPGLTDGRWRIGLPKSTALATFDASSALGSYIRPKEIRIRRMRAIADKARPMMDKLFPKEGLPFVPKARKDTLVAKDKEK